MANLIIRRKKKEKKEKLILEQSILFRIAKMQSLYLQNIKKVKYETQNIIYKTKQKNYKIKHKQKEILK